MENRELESDMMDIGMEYAEVMDLKMAQGRYFRKDLNYYSFAHIIYGCLRYFCRQDFQRSYPEIRWNH